MKNINNMTKNEVKIEFKNQIENINNKSYKLQNAEIHRMCCFSKTFSYKFAKLLRLSNKLSKKSTEKIIDITELMNKKVINDVRLGMFYDSKNIIVGMDKAFEKSLEETFKEYNAFPPLFEIDINDIKQYVCDNPDKPLKELAESIRLQLNAQLINFRIKRLLPMEIMQLELDLLEDSSPENIKENNFKLSQLKAPQIFEHTTQEENKEDNSKQENIIDNSNIENEEEIRFTNSEYAEETINKIIDKIEDIELSPEKLVNYLQIVKDNLNYSANNVALLWAQNHNIIQTKPYNKWLKEKTPVQQGEHGLMTYGKTGSSVTFENKKTKEKIVANNYREIKKYSDDENYKKISSRAKFGINYVFDITQTNADEEMIKQVEYKLNSITEYSDEQIEEIYSKLVKFAEKKNIQVVNRKAADFLKDENIILESNDDNTKTLYVKHSLTFIDKIDNILSVLVKSMITAKSPIVITYELLSVKLIIETMLNIDCTAYLTGYVKDYLEYAQGIEKKRLIYNAKQIAEITQEIANALEIA